MYVPGCAARPEAIIDGVVKGLAILEEKRLKVKRKTEKALKKHYDEVYGQEHRPLIMEVVTNGK